MRIILTNYKMFYQHLSNSYSPLLLILSFFFIIPTMSISNNFYKLTLLSVLAFSIFSYTKISFAQEAVNAPTIDAAPGPVITDETTTGATGDVFNPLWLLPLVAIPILLYLLWPRRNPRNSMDLSTDYAGVKGGRADSDDDADLETKPS